MLKNKRALVFMIVFITIVSAFSAALVEKRNKINAMHNEIQHKEEKLNELKELKAQILEMEKEKLAAIEKLNELKEKLNLENLEPSDISKVGDISENTPLNIETSAILISKAKKYNLKPSLILSIMEIESNFKKYEVGGHQDRGYMQIIPSTEKWLAKEFKHIHDLSYDPDRIFEPEYNIELAAVYLRKLKDSYGDDYNRILSEYNRGPYNLAKYYREHKTYETTYSKVILEREKKYLSFNN